MTTMVKTAAKTAAKTTANTAARTAAAGLLGLAILSGCSSRSEPEEQPAMANSLEEVSTPEEVTPVAAPVEAPPPAAAAAPVAPPRAAEVAPDAQMLDDADATGMTARVRRDGTTPDETAANETEPQ